MKKMLQTIITTLTLTIPTLSNADHGIQTATSKHPSELENCIETHKEWEETNTTVDATHYLCENNPNQLYLTVTQKNDSEDWKSARYVDHGVLGLTNHPKDIAYYEDHTGIKISYSQNGIIIVNPNTGIISVNPFSHGIIQSYELRRTTNSLYYQLLDKIYKPTEQINQQNSV